MTIQEPPTPVRFLSRFGKHIIGVQLALTCLGYVVACTNFEHFGLPPDVVPTSRIIAAGLWLSFVVTMPALYGFWLFQLVSYIDKQPKTRSLPYGVLFLAATLLSAVVLHLVFGIRPPITFCLILISVPAAALLAAPPLSESQNADSIPAAPSCARSVSIIVTLLTFLVITIYGFLKHHDKIEDAAWWSSAAFWVVESLLIQKLGSLSRTPVPFVTLMSMLFASLLTLTLLVFWAATPLPALATAGLMIVGQVSWIAAASFDEKYPVRSSMPSVHWTLWATRLVPLGLIFLIMLGSNLRFANGAVGGIAPTLLAARYQEDGDPVCVGPSFWQKFTRRCQPNKPDFKIGYTEVGHLLQSGDYRWIVVRHLKRRPSKVPLREEWLVDKPEGHSCVIQLNKDALPKTMIYRTNHKEACQDDTPKTPNEQPFPVTTQDLPDLCPAWETRIAPFPFLNNAYTHLTPLRPLLSALCTSNPD